MSSEVWENGVHPQVRELWPTKGSSDQARLLRNRGKIDLLTPLIMAAIADWFELFLVIWLAEGKNPPRWIARKNWALRLRRTLNVHVSRKCSQLKVSEVETSVYYEAIFNGMFDRMLALLGDGQVELEFLVQGLPTFRRDLVLRLANIDRNELRKSAHSEVLRFAAEPTDRIFDLASQRLVVVTDVGLSKMVDEPIHVPEREESNRQGVRELLQERDWSISKEMIERLFIRCYQDWMNAATDKQYLMRRYPHLFLPALEMSKQSD